MGKGMTPKKGYNQKLFMDNFDGIDFSKKPAKVEPANKKNIKERKSLR